MTNDFEYRKLADTIILQAVNDYRHTMKMLGCNNLNSKLLSEKQRLKVFFRSDWFQQLTSLDGRQLLIDLQKEAAQ